MILTWFLILPLAGALLALIVGRWSERWARLVSVIALALGLALAVGLWIGSPGASLGTQDGWIAQINLPWIPQLGLRFYLALDGLSLLLVLLTFSLGLAAVLASWQGISERVGFFHFNLLWALAGLVGVFLALDLLLFYFAFELMLVPLYLLIALWGHERRRYAAAKLFLFTQASGLLMLVAILGLYFAQGQATGNYTFSYPELLGARLPKALGMWLMLGFLAAFAVKLPVVPLHVWLPDAHTEAPTAGSVILAGLLLKVGAYGLLRFAVPLFPEAARTLAPVGMALGVLSILYGAVQAYGQTDLKRLVAYTSVSHMGFVMLGLFTWNELALQGVVLQIICHGFSTGALFILVGALQDRLHTRDLERMGGLWQVAPRLGGMALFFALASLGLPGLGNFLAEFLILVGAYQASPVAAILAALGLVAATVYALRMVQRAFHGPNEGGWKMADLAKRELGIMAAMIAVIVWLGVYPQPVLSIARQTLAPLLRAVPSLTARQSPAEMGKAQSGKGRNCGCGIERAASSTPGAEGGTP